MTQEQQRIAIAEACGWTFAGLCKCSEATPRGLHVDHPNGSKHLPDYINDLNAMHEAEKLLGRDDMQLYVNLLWPHGYSVQEAICATSAQRAKAFLLTIGKLVE